MAVTHWKSSIYTPGTIVAGYYGNAAGTAYAMMQGLGTAYKMTAGTAKLSGGSVNVTTNLAHIITAVASPAYHLGTAGAGVYVGTVSVACVFLPTAGTLALVTSDGVAISGTAYVAWQAIGY